MQAGPEDALQQLRTLTAWLPPLPSHHSSTPTPPSVAPGSVPSADAALPDAPVATSRVHASATGAGDHRMAASPHLPPPPLPEASAEAGPCGGWLDVQGGARSGEVDLGGGWPVARGTDPAQVLGSAGVGEAGRWQAGREVTLEPFNREDPGGLHTDTACPSFGQPECSSPFLEEFSSPGPGEKGGRAGSSPGPGRTTEVDRPDETPTTPMEKRLALMVAGQV